MIKNILIRKLLPELGSIKVLGLFVSTFLLIKGFITDGVWSTVTIALISLREASEARHNYFNNGNSANLTANRYLDKVEVKQNDGPTTRPAIGFGTISQD